jgi:hypothetical protein
MSVSEYMGGRNNEVVSQEDSERLWAISARGRFHKYSTVVEGGGGYSAFEETEGLQ